MLMKYIYKSLLFAVLAASTGMAAQAQEISFVQNRDARDQIGWPSHRTVPVVGDWNGDGFMDIYYGGTSCTNGWQTRGVIGWGNAEGTFTGDFEAKYEDYEDQQPIQQKNEDGSPKFDENGTPLYETDENGEYIYETVIKQRMVGMMNGTPLSAYGVASQTLDYNQDGRLDLLIQNIGGNDTGTAQSLVLACNNGDGTFTIVDDEALKNLTMNNAGENWNEGSEYGGVNIGDYDNDGFPDIIFQTWGWNRPLDTWTRDVTLLHNRQGNGFEVANVFRPLPVEKELNRIGIYVKTEDQTIIDEDGIEEIIPGEWTDQPTYAPKKMSHGNVCFVDLNNDGWQGIVVTGWADGNDTEQSGYEMRYYENTCDGWFQDATDKLIPFTGNAEASTIADVWSTWGGDDNIFQPFDYDQDGRQDLILIGSAVNRGSKQAYVLLNLSEGDHFEIAESQTKLAPLSGLPDRTFIYADFNGDDICDLFGRGWTDYDGRNDWTEALSTSKGINDYDVTMHGHDSNIAGAYIGERSTLFGDINNDGKLDIVASGWTDKSDDFIPSYNTTDYTPAAPAAPEQVSASLDENGNLVVSWMAVELNGTMGDALYNVYVLNNETGALRQCVPANLATGHQLGFSRFGCYAPGLFKEMPTKTFTGITNGSYTVGVQAVSYSYTASAFTTATVDVQNGIARVTPEAMKVFVEGDALTVSAPSTERVVIYNAAGQQVAEGVSGSPITVATDGVCIVRCGAHTAKIAK